MTAQRFLDDIQFILESEGLLRNDNAGEISHSLWNKTNSDYSKYHNIAIYSGDFL